MSEECLLICLLILVLFLIYKNATVDTIEYMGTGPDMFIEEGYGEHGQYYDNIGLEPVYRNIHIPTIYNS